MSFKQILIVVILAILIGGTVTFFIFKQNRVYKNTAEVTSISPTPTSVVLSTWTDEAGFSFQYPEGILIDKNADDTVNYANLTFTDSKEPGSINILMSDDTYKTLDKWIASNAELKLGGTIDTTLGGKDGKKILTTTETIIGVIDSEVLVTIRRDLNLSPLLENTWQKITNTWTFIYPTPDVTKSTQTTTVDNSGDILEEE